jgi:hypothetical protein
MGWLAIGAGLAFGAAMALLAAFFATSDERYDRIAEWSFVAFGILGVPTALQLADRIAAARPPSRPPSAGSASRRSRSRSSCSPSSLPARLGCSPARRSRLGAR